MLVLRLRCNFNVRGRTGKRETCVKQWRPQDCPEKQALVRKTKLPACSVINYVMRTKVVFRLIAGITCAKKLSNGKVKMRHESCIWVSHLNLNLNDISQGLTTA